MKQIYDFTQLEPPALSERSLQAQAAARRLQRQTALAALAGILIELCLLGAVIILAQESPAAALLCALYLLASTTGACILSIILAQKRREIFHA